MKCHFLTMEQRAEAENRRMALANTRQLDDEWMRANNAKYGWASFHEVVEPCAMWFSPWYFNPTDPDHVVRRERALACIADGVFGRGDKNFYLSRMYWQQWSDKRPPISVLCPNGVEWCVDSVSSNGDGWTVTGDPPLLTCSPSIVVPGYHGWLRNGEFTDA